MTDPTADFPAPPTRLLMGPGPVNADPRVQLAQASALVGQFDPWMTDTMNQTAGLLRGVFATANEATFVVDGTSRAGIEAALVSLLEPGDRVLVPVLGRFGLLLAEIAERAGAVVTTIHRPWGEVFTPDEVEAAVLQHRPKLLALVQADTSTTMLQPLAEIGDLCHRHGVLSYVDATASIGGNPLHTDDWRLDVVTAGLQKCLGGPSGAAPITLSPAAVDVIRARRHVEAGISDGSAGRGLRIGSNYFDLAMIMDYWGEQRLNHHTEAATLLYATRECARLLLAEGVPRAAQRHALHGGAMAAGLVGLGLDLFGDQAHRMANVVAARIPAGVDGEDFRRELLVDYGIEIGTSFGPLAGTVWRIGVMGWNARRDAVLVTLAAMEQVLRRRGVPVEPGAGGRAARRHYDEAGAL
ncbi:pyridoxal-phosphate-dependent aminotransferase family protein [Microlunatus sp. GCM10028923]|uniref:pyridoxal-phosphate-dependent aminotransferase family protein n=1 Tax=Microlunatus sp. GCM10028923 TaxID=3273400 RepID=UPI00360E5B37